MLKKITNQEMVDLMIGIQHSGSASIGNAKFKYALMLNENHISEKIKSLKKVIEDTLKTFIDAFKVEFSGKPGKDLSVTFFNLIGIPLPEGCVLEKNQELILQLQDKFTAEFKTAEELMNETIELNLHIVSLENVPDAIDYAILKKIKVIIADEKV